MEYLQQFHNVIASIMNVVPANQKALILSQLGCDKSIAAEERDMCFVFLRRLIADEFEDLVESCPKIFELCLTTASNEDDHENYRQSNMEILVSLCKKNPQLISNNTAKYVEPLVQQCFSMMTELDDDVAAWLKVDDTEDDIKENIASLGKTSIDRIICALGPELIFPLAFSIINDYKQSLVWKRKYAGIFGLSTISEGCKHQMELKICKIVDDLLLLLRHEHSRVRYAACNAIGKISSDFGPTFKKKYHEKVITALLEQAVDLATPRVSANALAALVSFAEDCPKNIMSKYLNQIMEKMQSILENSYDQLLQNRQKLVLLQVITTIDFMADSTKTDFVKYYAGLMPTLKKILNNSYDTELSKLHEKTIECISLIGLVVGHKVFKHDIKEIMTKLIPADEGFSSDEARNFACKTLICFAREMKSGFAPYVNQVAEFMESQWMSHDEVRTFAAEILPHLFAAVRNKDDRKVLWNLIFRRLLEALKKESDLEIVGKFLFSIGASVEELKADIVSSDDLTKIVAEIHSQLIKYERRRFDREQASKDEVNEQTQEELKEVIEQEAVILERITDLIHFLFLTFKGNFVDLFAPVVPQFAKLIEPESLHFNYLWVYLHEKQRKMDLDNLAAQKKYRYVCLFGAIMGGISYYCIKEVYTFLSSYPGASSITSYPKFEGPQNNRQKTVVDAMKYAWNGYKKFAWGKDTFMPISEKSQERMQCGLTIIDSLDTLIIMGMDDEFTEARKWVETEFTFDKDKDVNLFETTVRVLGGLLSTFHLTGDHLFLDKAEDLGSRLIGGLHSSSPIPYSDVNLKTRKGKYPSWGGESPLSEVTSIQLEFRALSRALNNGTYEKEAFKVSEYVHQIGCKSHEGLCEQFLSPSIKDFEPGPTIKLGATSDSYYEYLLKQWLQTGKTVDWLKQDYEESMNGVKNLLWRFSEPSKLALPGELFVGNKIFPKMDHLVCFLAGTLALGSQNGMPNEHMEMARNLSKSCRAMYDTVTGLRPEVVRFNKVPGKKEDFLIDAFDVHGLLRPEAFEAWFYMFRITGDKIYQEWGWKAFEAIEKHAKVKNGYSSVNSVEKIPVIHRDLMESFFLAETLKYLYLLFADDQIEIPLDKYVFNTGGHVMLIYNN